MVQFLMKIILFILISAGANSCVTLSYYNSPEVNPEAQVYLDSFKTEAAAQGYYYNTDNLILQIIDVPNESDSRKGERTIGTCYYGLDRPYIVIDSEWWGKADYYSREAVLFHELGHCYLGRLHKEDMMPFYENEDVQASLMNHVAPTGSTYITLRNYYIQELFENVPEELKAPHRVSKIPCRMLLTCK